MGSRYSTIFEACNSLNLTNEIMAQYVFFLILSLGLYFASPSTTSSSSTKKPKQSLRIIKTDDGGQGGWVGGGK